MYDVLAHMGGVDEAAVVALPLVATAVLLWFARRRAADDEAVEKEDGEGDDR
ncbi:MAG: hypothetical protein KY439_09555 [Actinobacteria bacterium]|nr:hypothetical protein [Actinomycetota bacterium]